ncbi:MAG: tRNA (adenosine(37)-N6)-threonylcarbamoyltransferase complex transferase subunit TsaD [Acidimicrobiia bacterium]|nr:tRNA (adenosine(37)-N6)-threonylcarbamoyltransferase complex transferase subunit TsaD [Acidimicrobiia bacterium]
MTTILGIETSCDETAAAVVVDGLDIRSNVISTQVELHARFGGVVPEVASRAHLESINAVITRALDEAGTSLGDLDAVAACHGPGLAGALLVGVSAGKALALVLDVPYVGVHHLEAHLHAAWLEDPSVEMPMAVLLVSGGHTMIVSMEGTGRYRILGQTVDDAAGEAYDKVARALGLGYPGGPVIDRIAKDGDPTGVVFPRPMLNEGLDFSFSGLKTAVMLEIRRNPDRPAQDIAASFQEAVVETLVYKLEKAADQIGARTLVLGGGVAANSRLRARVAEVAEKSGRRALLPRHDLCTDNGAMIAAAAHFRLLSDGPTPLDDGAIPGLVLPSIA